jgi:probable rRNA maturation factor
MAGFSITKTKTPIPRLPYEQIKNDILGTEYVVSLVFVGEKRAQALNEAYRQKTYTPNVLAFPLDDSNGEIFICTKKLPKEAPLYNMNVRTYTAYLFIHALLHLKGYDHGATMERTETKFLKKFGLA